MRLSKLFAVLILGVTGCPDFASLQTGSPDLTGQIQDMANGLPSDWTSVYASPGVPLNAISGVAGAPDQITVVGNAQTVVRGNGSAFTAATIPGASTDFQALWVNGQAEVWAVGTGGQVWRTVNGGANWADMMSGVTFTLRGIFAKNGNNQDIVTAGDDTTNGRHWGGTDWQNARHGRNDRMLGVWASNLTFWVVGTSGDSAIATDGRGTWTNITDITNGPTINAVFGIDDANVWGVTEAGGLFKFDLPNTQWNIVTSVTGALRAMWINSATEIWVAGELSGNGIVFRCDGVAKTCVDESSAALSQHTITGIWGNSAGGIWITANNGTSGVIFKR